MQNRVEIEIEHRTHRDFRRQLGRAAQRFEAVAPAQLSGPVQIGAGTARLEREHRERLIVAREGTDQNAVVHERSLASPLITAGTPPILEIRRRVSSPGGVRTRDRQIRVLKGRPTRTKPTA